MTVIFNFVIDCSSIDTPVNSHKIMASLLVCSYLPMVQKDILAMLVQNYLLILYEFKIQLDTAFIFQLLMYPENSINPNSFFLKYVLLCAFNCS